MPAEEVEVSVVIPCLNEANSLAICIDKAFGAFRGAGLSGEVVVADNGSTDGSIEIGEAHGARVIRVAQRGYGAALQAGIAASRGRLIIMGDADDSYDFSVVPQFVLKWREGYDLVMGNRFRGGIKSGAMPWHHKYFGNPGLTALLNLLFRTGIGDCYCGMRGFSRAMYDRLDVRSTGMEFAPELIIKAAQIGAKITEIPIILWPDKRGLSTSSPQLSGRLAHAAIFPALRTQLAFSVARVFAVVSWAGAGLLALARPAPSHRADRPGYSHHGLRRDFHADGRSDHQYWVLR